MAHPDRRDPRASANPYEAKRAKRDRPARASNGDPSGATRRTPRGAGHALRNAVIAAFASVTVVVAPWAVDVASTANTVHRNTTLDARGIGTLSPTELDQAIDETAAAWAALPVSVRTPRGTADLTLGQLGITLDRAAVRTAALAIGRDDAFPAGLLAWWKSWIAPREVPLRFDGDATIATRALAPLEQQNRKEPVEASVRSTPSGLQLVAATPGTTLDTLAIHTTALELARAGQRRITVEAGTVPLPPKFPASVGQELLDRADRSADSALEVHVGDAVVTVDAATIRSWLSSAVKADGSGLELAVDQAKIEVDVPRLVGSTGTPPVQLAFGVDFLGNVVIIDGADGTTCCAPDSARRVVDALTAKRTSVVLDTEPVKPEHDRAWAEELGIIEPIGTFTTPHECCKPRVTNIHLFADTLRGRVIEPGDTLSLNGAVGPRTPEKGYVVDHAIVDGKYEDNVGGGVSQFAATTFNAAFFAGLDILEYQMHTIAIDRYPFGREATISWEKPDLRIRNNTPFGVLLWPTYTDTSLTVTLFSTRWVRGEQTNQTVTEVKARDKDPETGEEKVCRKVVTERTRTFFGDNRTERDSFVALYQPDEGIRC